MDARRGAAPGNDTRGAAEGNTPFGIAGASGSHDRLAKAPKPCPMQTCASHAHSMSIAYSFLNVLSPCLAFSVCIMGTDGVSAENSAQYLFRRVDDDLQKSDPEVDFASISICLGLLEASLTDKIRQHWPRDLEVRL